MKKTIITFLAIALFPLFNQAQSSWIVNNFKSYLSDNETDAYIDKASDIINELQGTNKVADENILNLFKLLANINTKLDADKFQNASNAVGITYTTKSLSSNLSILSYTSGMRTSYILRNTDKENGYQTNLKGSRKSNFNSSTSSIIRGIGKNQYANLSRSEEFYIYELVNAEKIQSMW